MNLQRYNLAKRFRAVERVTLGNCNTLIAAKNVVTTTIKIQNNHNMQLAILHDRISVLEAMLNVTPNDSSYRFGIVKRPDA